MSKLLQHYIGGGMPKWLQYYMGGGGFRDPQRDYVICARPLSHFLGLPVLMQYVWWTIELAADILPCALCIVIFFER